MKRSGFRMFDWAAGLSLLLCLASAGLWEQSWVAMDTLWWARGGRLYVIDLYGGHLDIGRVSGWTRDLPVSGAAVNVDRFDPAVPAISMSTRAVRMTAWSWVGVQSREGQGFVRLEHRVSAALVSRIVRVGISGLPFLFLILPNAWVISRARRGRLGRRRERMGLCLFCGYDMRATLEKCPECGRMRDLKLE